MKNAHQPNPAQQPTGSNGFNPVEVIHGALQQSMQNEASEFAEMLSQHQLAQDDMATKIAAYLESALNRQSLAARVLHKLEGRVLERQTLALEEVALDVPSLPTSQLFRKTYEQATLFPKPKRLSQGN